MTPALLILAAGLTVLLMVVRAFVGNLWRK